MLHVLYLRSGQHKAVRPNSNEERSKDEGMEGHALSLKQPALNRVEKTQFESFWTMFCVVFFQKHVVGLSLGCQEIVSTLEKIV